MHLPAMILVFTLIAGWFFMGRCPQEMYLPHPAACEWDETRREMLNSFDKSRDAKSDGVDNGLVEWNIYRKP